MNNVDIVAEAARRYPRIGIAFNGGKDSVVVAHMCLQAGIDRERLVFYRVIKDAGDEFKELHQYVCKMCDKWGISQLLTFETHREAITRLTQEHGVEAIVAGTRHTDPDARHIKGPFQETDANWPSVMRVNPILSWSYNDVWRYLDQHEIPVCALYTKHGYTSLGSKHNTKPNSALYDPATQSYRHAKYLKDAATERNGRM